MLLFLKVIFSWMEGGKCVSAVGGHDIDAELPCSVDFNSVSETCASGNVKCVCESSSPGKRKFRPKGDTFDTDSGNPIDEVLHWHNAIKRELDEIAAEARRIELAGELSSLAPFYARLQFIAEVCIFHRYWSMEILIHYLIDRNSSNLMTLKCKFTVSLKILCVPCCRFYFDLRLNERA